MQATYDNAAHLEFVLRTIVRPDIECSGIAVCETGASGYFDTREGVSMADCHYWEYSPETGVLRIKRGEERRFCGEFDVGTPDSPRRGVEIMASAWLAKRMDRSGWEWYWLDAIDQLEACA